MRQRRLNWLIPVHSVCGCQKWNPERWTLPSYPLKRPLCFCHSGSGTSSYGTVWPLNLAPKSHAPLPDMATVFPDGFHACYPPGLDCMLCMAGTEGTQGVRDGLFCYCHRLARMYVQCYLLLGRTGMASVCIRSAVRGILFHLE